MKCFKIFVFGIKANVQTKFHISDVGSKLEYNIKKLLGFIKYALFMEANFKLTYFSLPNPTNITKILIEVCEND